MSYTNSNYRGRIPFELYVRMENEFPRVAIWEKDYAWLNRIIKKPSFKEKFPNFVMKPSCASPEVMQAVHRRWMALAGARRGGANRPGPRLVTVNARGVGGGVKNTIAKRYEDELLAGDKKERLAQQAYDLLMADFDGSTPVDGGIFWNGINELALAKLVSEWNVKYGREVFGQLEATTPARYVNKQFVWEEGAFERYFREASDQLGASARGHITAVVRHGMRDDSIFTTTELPRMFRKMKANLNAGQTPEVTNITIVVIEPKTTHETVRAYTNNQIWRVPIIKKKRHFRFIGGRDSCAVKGFLPNQRMLEQFWKEQTKTQPAKHSTAALHIMKDVTTLTQWN
ncbi:hypothetical protein Enr13x_56220 [Stieleria neptunia]|uniref:Uncharacterized protein n=1 Tax=Stieleria neptunia TaxID=2527979 RepID=A0A518HXZ9_9BACT|nr:hypothetical protein [Stieleria neptunia]QDV45743.1 hypothetical protein Enr13x_56220 [Stieleria neptunia]